MNDLSKSYLPFATVISLVLFVAWGTRVVTTAQLEMNQKFVESARVVKELAGATKDLAAAFSVRDAHGWTREDMIAWCEVQKARVSGLECPRMVQQPYSRIQDSFNGVGRIQKKLEIIEGDDLLKVTPPKE